MPKHRLSALTAIALMSALAATPQSAPAPQKNLPRTADGKPNFEGIWQASSTAAADLQDHAARYNMLAGRSVIEGGEIPYQPWAAAKKAENFQNRQKADPLNQCFIPGVPRIMYLDFPFQIFQTPQAIAMAFEWSLDYRLIHTNGTPHPADLDSWIGDSRGHWEGDTLVVDVSNNNDKTWFDMAGDFHSDALHIVERYRMTDPIRFSTRRPSKTRRFSRNRGPSTSLCAAAPIAIGFSSMYVRRKPKRPAAHSRVSHERGIRAMGRTPAGSTSAPAAPKSLATPAKAGANLRRRTDGKPDLQGFYVPDAGGANYGLEKRAVSDVTPGGRGVIIDPPDGKLPVQPWAVQEKIDRNRTERGYDDPTAHCFPAGVPRSMYVPTSFQIIQTADYIVFLHERTSWRIVSLKARGHLPDGIRLWQGDSVGRWEGDTLVVDTANLNGKTWLNEGGEVVSYAEHVVERFTPTAPDTVSYEATVTDPVVYTRPWTIAVSFKHDKFELTEAACHEEDRDLPRLKALKDAAAAKK